MAIPVAIPFFDSFFDSFFIAGAEPRKIANGVEHVVSPFDDGSDYGANLLLRQVKRGEGRRLVHHQLALRIADRARHTEEGIGGVVIPAEVDNALEHPRKKRGTIPIDGLHRRNQRQELSNVQRECRLGWLVVDGTHIDEVVAEPLAVAAEHVLYGDDGLRRGLSIDSRAKRR
ncbi:MAG TPA: hypothetical protein PKI03_21820 [Pseudomonadota bacterium]|nr:hypothetical protein [Pseudomonadota bacterium]